MSHAELVERSIAHVESSKVSKGDKKLLLDRIPYCSTDMLEMFVEVCDEDPFSVDILVKNLKKKLDAQGNLSKIHDIVKEEEVDIEGLLPDEQ